MEGEARVLHPVPRIGSAKFVHGLFERQVALAPHAPAVLHGGQRLTYSQLNLQASRLARYLRNQGVTPNRVVGVCVGRGASMVVGLLGILKAGGAYLPLDPNYPSERLEYMMEDADPAVVLTHEELRPLLPETGAECVALDATLKRIGGYVGENLAPADIGLDTDDLLYLIYTSGSTGRPKGIEMPHRSMVNLLEWHQSEFGLHVGRRVLQFAALSFDVAFQEIFSTLCTGGTLVMLDEWVRRDASQLLRFLNDNAIERLFVPPLMLQALAGAYAASGVAPRVLRDVVAAGEQLRVTREVVDLFRAMPECRLHNHYGPTETHVVTALTLAGDPARWPALPTIGRPIDNAHIHILDEHREPVAAGLTGEIYIGGTCLARGYRGRPDLTAQRFVADPFGSADGMIYRTGDVGRRLPDGTIEYLGRNDDQVKIRGFRVELGEVEAQLARHPLVREAAVVAREEATGKRLVAYVTCANGQRPSIDVLRAHAKAVLPEFMVPSAFVVLPALPTTPNGKLDRRALPPPDASAYASRAYEPPVGESEQALALIWADLLNVSPVGRQDHFFELGGDSLLIAEMLGRLRKTGLSLEARSVYTTPTLAALAREVHQVSQAAAADAPGNGIPPECDAITPEMLPLLDLSAEQIEQIERSVPGGPRNIQDIYPLAPLQEGILFHHLFNTGRGDTYLLPVLLSVASRDRLEDLIGGLQQVIDRHDVLRTMTLWENLPAPVQVVLRGATLPVEELTLSPERDAVEQLRERMRPDVGRIDLRLAPMIRLQVARDARTGGWHALLQVHHFVCDHESLDAMLAEVLTCADGAGEKLPVAAPYRQYVAHSRAASSNDEAEAFFRAKLGGIDDPTAPFGLLDVHGDGTRIVDVRQPLSKEMAARVREQAKLLGVSAAALFHAAWALVVAHTSGRDDVVFGTLLSSRLQGSPDAQRTLGMFINTLPLRLQLADITTRELIVRTQRELVELLAHEKSSLAVAQRCSGITGTAPLFTALLNYLHSGTSPHEAETGSGSGIRVLEVREWTNYPVVLSVDDQRDGFVLTAQVDRSVEARRVMSYVLTALSSMLDALAQASNAAALSLSILPSSEREEVVTRFNATTTKFPADDAIHTIFEKRVRHAPEAIAVLWEEERVTYADLNRRANRLSRHLLREGVRAGECIPVYMPRGLQMVIAQLAVLKCGGAYVPIDSALPIERQLFMLTDCGARRVVSAQPLPVGLGRAELQWIDCMANAARIDEESDGDLDVRVSGQSSAYVMYTSGSTGTPKGVVISHRGVNRLAINNGYLQIVPSDCVVHASNPAFDASTFEVWATLLNGARLLIVPPAVVLEPDEFAAMLAANGVTVLFQTTALFNQVAASKPETYSGLRHLFFGGEMSDASAVRKVLQLSAPPQLLHVYGPTETTTFATWYPVTAVPDGVTSLPIGGPIANTTVYILDRRGEPAPIGVTGEIHIGGAGLALEYLNRPELTASKFVPHPFSHDTGARVFRSGDLGRWRADGAIEFLGRNDHQVKIRGFRIELGEIEAQLARHPRVREVVVIAREHRPGEKFLVAYVTHGRGSAPDVDDLRSHLREVLPEYMVPSAFVVLDALPLTSNGKVDRRALPQPELVDYTSREFDAPRGEVETVLADIWRGLLRLDRVGRADNFFELGGHSLLATRVVSAVRELLHIELPVKAMFEAPVFRDLAGRIEHQLQAQAAHDARWMNDRARDFRRDIDEMGEEDVMVRIAELEKELAASQGAAR